MSTKNKNQTAIERAKRKVAEGLRLSRHYCAHEQCPTPDQRIMIKDLFPVVQASIKGKKTVAYHSQCFNG